MHFNDSETTYLNFDLDIATFSKKSTTKQFISKRVCTYLKKVGFYRYKTFLK